MLRFQHYSNDMWSNQVCLKETELRVFAEPGYVRENKAQLRQSI